MFHATATWELGVRNIYVVARTKDNITRHGSIKMSNMRRTLFTVYTFVPFFNPKTACEILTWCEKKPVQWSFIFSIFFSLFQDVDIGINAINEMRRQNAFAKWKPHTERVLRSIWCCFFVCWRYWNSWGDNARQINNIENVLTNAAKTNGGKCKAVKIIRYLEPLLSPDSNCGY